MQSTSSQSQKRTNLLGMINSAEVASRENSSTKEDALEFTINIKPAQKKRSINDFEIIKELGTGSYGKALMVL